MPVPFALCAYSVPHLMGYLKTRDGELCPAPLTPLQLMDTAVELGLSGVEFPLSSLVPSFDGARIQTDEITYDVTRELATRGLRIVADYGAILDHDADHLRDYLTLAAGVGATTVRTVLSHLLCGDRRKLAGGWEAHRDALAARLREVLPHAESLGICIAVENHQDATSEDLLILAEQVKHSPSFGVTLDAGNPLAVCEDPVTFTKRIEHIIRHVHMKDYTIHFAPEGYRLVRCAAGDGVVDFPAILKIVRANGHEVLPAIEIAAQATRTIPFLEEDWWNHYPASQRAYLTGALRVLWAQGRPQAEPYSSAWERGEASPSVCAEEWDIVRRSALYFRTGEESGQFSIL